MVNGPSGTRGQPVPLLVELTARGNEHDPATIRHLKMADLSAVGRAARANHVASGRVQVSGMSVCRSYIILRLAIARA